MSLNSGYICLPRSLILNPLWIDLPSSYKEVFLVILELVRYGSPTQFDDHGHLITILPGQLCISEQGLADKCSKYITKTIVHRTILKLDLYGFVHQQVNHKKTLITITHPETYDLISKNSESTSESNLNQTRIKLESQKNKEKKKKKETTSPQPLFKENLEEVVVSSKFFNLANLSEENGLPFSPAQIITLCENFSFEAVKETIVRYRKRSAESKSGIHSPDQWLESEVKKQFEYLSQKQKMKG